MGHRADDRACSRAPQDPRGPEKPEERFSFALRAEEALCLGARVLGFRWHTSALVSGGVNAPVVVEARLIVNAAREPWTGRARYTVVIALNDRALQSTPKPREARETRREVSFALRAEEALCLRARVSRLDAT